MSPIKWVRVGGEIILPIVRLIWEKSHNPKSVPRPELKTKKIVRDLHKKQDPLPR